MHMWTHIVHSCWYCVQPLHLLFSVVHKYIYIYPSSQTSDDFENVLSLYRYFKMFTVEESLNIEELRSTINSRESKLVHYSYYLLPFRNYPKRSFCSCMILHKTEGKEYNDEKTYIYIPIAERNVVLHSASPPLFYTFVLFARHCTLGAVSLGKMSQINLFTIFWDHSPVLYFR